MSVLGRDVIIESLTNRQLVVSPILAADQVGASSIDLRMGTVVLMARAGRRSHVDPAAYKAPSEFEGIESLKQKHERFDVPFKQSFLLHPGSLALVPTLEWVQLPAHLQGVVTARSSWAREGLNIATATIINPGYQGIITLELANFGEIPISIFPGLRIAQIAFYQLTASDSPVRVGDKSQFDFAFEPKAGDIAKGDAKFIPDQQR
ncbi:MAG TPA: dCTP deaminase [Steroidobacteraceae bacterium]|jgi:dCTP deaminase|nr:dCTP deaminase [Steroidobacteraceae bacterium]